APDHSIFLRWCKRDGAESVGALPAGAELAHLDRRPLGGGTLAGDRDGLRLGRAIEQEEASDDLLRLREWTVDHASLAAASLDAHRVGLERLVGPEQAAGLEGLGETNHALVRLPAFLARPAPPHLRVFHDQHHVRHDDPPTAPNPFTEKSMAAFTSTLM